MIADFEEPGDADVLRKVLGDLIDKGIATDEHKVRHEMTVPSINSIRRRNPGILGVPATCPSYKFRPAQKPWYFGCPSYWLGWLTEGRPIDDEAR